MKWVLREITGRAHGGLRCRGRQRRRPVFRWTSARAYRVGDRCMSPTPTELNSVGLSEPSMPSSWRYAEPARRFPLWASNADTALQGGLGPRTVKPMQWRQPLAFL
jgi:hypothetical protein